MAEEQILTGTLRRVRFMKPSGWLVAEVETERGARAVTVTGVLPALSIGDRYDFFGKQENSDQWGKQFKAFRAVPSEEQNGIDVFLELMPGIGPARAKKIRERFGDTIWEVLEKRPNELVSAGLGLSETSVKRVHEEYVRRKADRELLVWCADQGIRPYLTNLIRDKFQHEATKIIKLDPYRLLEVPGIGFLTADRIALKTGVGALDRRRCAAAIEHVVAAYEEQDGSTMIDADSMLASLLGHDRDPRGRPVTIGLSPPVPQEIVYDVLGGLIRGGTHSLIKRDGRSFIQRQKARIAELSIANFVAERITGRKLSEEPTEKPCRSCHGEGMLPALGICPMCGGDGVAK